MTTINMPAWQLFDRTFKEGDDVIVVMENEWWAWGKLEYVTHIGADLRQGIHVRSVYWSEIRFICHDGFPLKKLKGADGSASIEKTMHQRGLVKKIMEKKRGFKELVFDDPFYIEGIFRATLYNEGNEDPAYFFTDNEEVLELVAPDGATAHLWTLNTVWHALPL